MPSGNDNILAGRRIIVTRPLAQAAGLIQLIRASGGTAVVVPALEIVPLASKHCDISQQLQKVAGYDLAIFVSPNAVHLANQQMPLTALAFKSIVAPGTGTAKALHDCGLHTVLTPAEGHTSEDLLTLDALHKVRNKRIAIVRGAGGREVLRDKLVRRGASVDYIEVYRRQRPPDCCTQLQSALATNAHALLVSSGQALENLLSCPGAQALTEVPVFVPSQRLANCAQDYGFAIIRVCPSPGDAGVIDALLAWART